MCRAVLFDTEKLYETLFDAERLNSQQEILIIFRAFWAAVGTKVIKHLIMLISKTITQINTMYHVPFTYPIDRKVFIL